MCIGSKLVEKVETVKKKKKKIVSVIFQIVHVATVPVAAVQPA